MSISELRLCAVGDELVAGVGDPRALGWLGRVVARTRTQSTTVVMPLAVPSETTTGLSARWENEFNLRTAPNSHTDHRLIIGLGHSDISADLSVARSRLNLANILDVADERRIPTLVVGPPPTIPSLAPAIGELSAAFADVAQRRRVPYVDTFSPLVDHEQWNADLAASNGPYPGQAGYGLMAWLVLHTGWHTWLGLPEDE
ncbi:GDSL-type esterase/lipase family protein [Timonella sp. A28]|uniref:GDSL-type esterase/lipase family protein n=1 Tax=Timonella sp. A28 TaxID=3442640 RepID=UPI003EC14040